MNLLFCINHTYINHFINCVKSIVRFPNKYQIYVFHTDLTVYDEELIKYRFSSLASFNFIFIDNTLLNTFPISRRYPTEIYYRILAANYLPENLDKILYLDVDIVVINPLDKLYETDIDDYYYAACTHVRKLLTFINNRRLRSNKMNPYVNTGMLLMNLKKLRKEQVKEEIFLFVKKHQNHLLLPDQDIISILYGEKIKILDYLKYNLSERLFTIYNFEHLSDRKSIDWVQNNTCIIHYCGKNKPWNKKYYGKLNRFYQYKESDESYECV